VKKMKETELGRAVLALLIYMSGTASVSTGLHTFYLQCLADG